MDSLLAAGTAVVCDVLDANGIRPPVLTTGLRAVTPGAAFVGPAFTVAGRSEEWTDGGDRDKLAAIDAMPPGCVAVWAGGDIRGVCCFGDLLATSMHARGCAGVVVDGGVRDVAYLADLGLPVVSRFSTPAQAIGRWKVTAQQRPVHVRGAIDDWVTVDPGDIVVVDRDGAGVVPASIADGIARQAQEGAGGEVSARREIAAGPPLLAALERYGHL